MDHPPFVLIIDDDPDDADFLIDAFMSHYPDASFHHSETGNAGIKFLADAAALNSVLPDMIFLDLHLPGKSGYDTLVELKGDESFKMVPVFIISTSALGAEAIDCRSAGCADYFQKPTSLQAYDDIVKKSVLHRYQSGVRINMRGQ